MMNEANRCLWIVTRVQWRDLFLSINRLINLAMCGGLFWIWSIVFFWCFNFLMLLVCGVICRWGLSGWVMGWFIVSGKKFFSV